MPLIKVKAKEMLEADVKFVSLVKSPANRIPFRVVKSDEGQNMINLSGLFAAKKRDGEDVETVQTFAHPAVVAAVVRLEDAEDTVPLIEAAGLSTQRKTEFEGMAIYTQKDFKESEVVAFKSGDVVLLIDGVQKAFQPFLDSDSFQANVQAAGFLPTVQQGINSMADTVTMILAQASSAGEAKDKLKEVVEEFGGFMTALTDTLPEEAFKLDSEEAKKQSGGMHSPDSAVVTDTDESDQAESVEHSAEGFDPCPSGFRLGASGKCEPVNPAGAEVSVSNPEPLVPSAEMVQRSDEDCGCEETEVEKQDPTAEILANLATISKGLDEVRGTMEKLETRVKSAEEAAESASKAVRGTTLQGSTGGENAGQPKAVEKQADLWGGTALDRLCS